MNINSDASKLKSSGNGSLSFAKGRMMLWPETIEIPIGGALQVGISGRGLRAPFMNSVGNIIVSL